MSSPPPRLTLRRDDLVDEPEVERLLRGEHVAEGFLSNYSFHAGSLKIKLFGGERKKILFRRHGIKVERLPEHSWMPPASAMGLSDQDVRDIAEYLKGL